MFATAHVCSGALLGRVVGRPFPAFVLGVASHVALDACPHWGMDVHAEGGRQRFLAIAAVDGIVLTTALAWLARSNGRDPAALAGALGALSLDLDKPAAELGVSQLWPDRLHRLHLGVQTHEAPGRWPIDLAVTLGSLAGLRRLHRHPATGAARRWHGAAR
jgi:hypothetical protein